VEALSALPLNKSHSRQRPERALGRAQPRSFCLAHKTIQIVKCLLERQIKKLNSHRAPRLVDGFQKH